jgi:cobalt-zinc-cadmium efflux system outer membrane protein
MRIGASILAAIVTNGCATLRPGLGITDVQELVSGRTVGRVHWNLGTAEDREIAQRTHALLQEELTLEAAVQIALFNNHELQATYQRLGIAQADLVKAGLLPNPILHAGLRLPASAPSSSVELSLLQDFIAALQVPLRKRVAASVFEEAKLEVAEAVVDLAFHVKVAFYGLQGAQQMLDLRRTIAQAAEYSAEIARRQRAAGNITRLDLANERALFEHARLEVARAEADVLAAREEVTSLLGLWGTETDWTIAPTLPDLPNDMQWGGLELFSVS